MFFSGLFETKNIKGIDYNSVIENFILEVYAFLTCVIEVKTNKSKAVQTFETEAEMKKVFYLNRVYLLRKEQPKRSSGTKQKITANELNNLIKIRKHIKAYIRKLPAGQETSDDAKALASAYGIELEKGYTFVSEFEKTVYILNE